MPFRTYFHWQWFPALFSSLSCVIHGNCDCELCEAGRIRAYNGTEDFRFEFHKIPSLNQFIPMSSTMYYNVNIQELEISSILLLSFIHGKYFLGPHKINLVVVKESARNFRIFYGESEGSRKLSFLFIKFLIRNS